ncbi:MAG: hypothetical protein ABI083_10915 [Lapillicoccus sp.]
MRLPFVRKATTLDEVSSALELGRREGILAVATDTDSGVWLAATTHAIALVSPRDGLVWRRPWHEVDRGSWDGESGLLTISWADRGRPGQWRLGEEALFLQTLRERVQASVVLTQELPLSGRRTGRAVIRQDLATGDLIEQVVLARGVGDDPEVEAAAAIAFAFLREQVGLPT